MADAHFGYGMPIGGVMATEDVVIPNAVGVDIGCGICCVQTSLTEIERPILKKIIKTTRQVIPCGFKHHRSKQNSELMPQSTGNDGNLEIVTREFENALTQLGTLGGGNHFIELQEGSDNHIWIMIHSGSRNLGYQVANYYNKLAIQLNKKTKPAVNPKWQLAYLPLFSTAGQKYMAEMQYCVDFALSNRQHMMAQMQEVFRDIVGPVHFAEPINIAHNYAALENHFGKEVLIHRKGATSAFAEQIGVIPGSQGSKSYIVKGLGNTESFCSCSHGAGRKLGRKQAQRTLKLEEEIAYLDKQNILHAVRSKRDLDEAAGAYKDIHTVLQNQKDLIEVIIDLQPLAVIKG